MGVIAGPELRVQVAATRFRIPDVTVMRRSDPPDDIVRVAPLLCIEILSRDESLSELQERVDDYQAMGVEHIWVIDPWKRRAYVATSRHFEQPADQNLSIPGTRVIVSLIDVFAELDQMRKPA